MKSVSIALYNIVLLLIVISTTFCQIPDNNFQQQENSSTKYELPPLLNEDRATKLLITEGSSTTEGHAVTNEYPKQLAGILGGNYFKQTVGLILDSNNLWTVRNMGNGGDTMAQITSQYSSQVLPFYNPSLTVNYLTLQTGSNDIANGRPTATLKTEVAAYVAKAKADGFVVGVCTVFHRVGTDLAKVGEYNSWLRNGNSGADFIVDLAAHPSLSNATNLTYFQGDGIHTNNNGQAVIAGIFAESLPVTATASVGYSIGGRAITASGRSIPNALVTLTDPLGNTRKMRTSAFGYYRFRAVASGQTYFLKAQAKRYVFGQSSYVLNISEDAANINFVANP